MKRRKVLFVQLSRIRLMVKKFAISLLFLIAFIMMLFNKTDTFLIDKTSSVATDIFSPIVELLAIPAKIACTDDKPMARKNVDTLYVGAKEVLLDTVDLSAYLYDPDGDSLTFSVTSNLSIEKKLEWEIKGNLLQAMCGGDAVFLDYSLLGI